MVAAARPCSAALTRNGQFIAIGAEQPWSAALYGVLRKKRYENKLSRIRRVAATRPLDRARDRPWDRPASCLLPGRSRRRAEPSIRLADQMGARDGNAHLPATS